MIDFSRRFGDGSDGDFDLDGTNTYSGILGKSGDVYTMLRDIHAENLQIDSGKTLVTDGYILNVRDTISGAGLIKWGTPNNGSAGTTPGSANGGAGATASGNGRLKSVAGGDGGNGGNAPDGAGGAGGSPSTINGIGTDNTGTGASGGGGQPGGQGGAGSAGSGGNSQDVDAPFTPVKVATAFQVIHGVDIDYTGALVVYKTGGSGAGGGGGAGGGSGVQPNQGGGGGGGGAAGGIVWINAQNFTGSFNIESVGGNGGGGSTAFANGGGGGGGAGGNGGSVVRCFNVDTWTGSYVLTGGTGGGGGNGSNGGGTGGTGSNGETGTYYEIQLVGL